MAKLAVLCFVLLAAAANSLPPGVPLQNAADANVVMPWSGAGSGGYTGNSTTFGTYPECWLGCSDPQCLTPDPPGFKSCAQFVDAAIAMYLQLHGPHARIDNSDSYHSQMVVGRSLAASGRARSDVFFTSKVGPYLAMGGAEATEQFHGILQATGLSFVDLLLVHWPSCVPSEGGSACPNATSSEPVCQVGGAAYDAAACRLDTWRALVAIWKSGGARAIGVSNYNASHLQEIKDAGLPLPAVNQIPYNIYSSSKQDETVAWCAAHNVLVNGYSPFGVPDHRTFFPPQSRTVFEDPVVVAIAAAHATSPAEVILAWHYQLGVVFNPRSMNAAHILENLGATATPWWTINLSAAEMAQLSSRPQA
jgi:diketogulonate reductase-like aldo/keto reductase